jgi:hypothetical protein
MLGIGLDERRLRLDFVQGGATNTIKGKWGINQDFSVQQRRILNLSLHPYSRC